MASDFDTLMGNANVDFLAQFGIDIQYTPAGGTVRTIRGVLEPPNEDNIREGNVELQYTFRQLWISSRNNTEGVTAPKQRGKSGGLGGDTLTIEGGATTWYVQGVDSSEPGMHRLEIVDNSGAIL